MFNAVALGARRSEASCGRLADLIDRTRSAVLGAASEAAQDMSPLELPAKLLGRFTRGITELELLIGTGILARGYLQNYRDAYLRELDRLTDELRPEDRERLERLAVLPSPAEPVGVGLGDVAEVVGVGLRGSAWDQVGVAHPTPDTIHITPSGITHILDGNATGGGHAPGKGIPGKSEFPPGWSRAKIVSQALSVARDPVLVDGPLKHGRWRVEGIRDGVKIRVILESNGEIVTGFPLKGPGVMRNPR